MYPGSRSWEAHVGDDSLMKIATLDEPGLGCRPRPELLERFTKAVARVE